MASNSVGRDTLIDEYGSARSAMIERWQESIDQVRLKRQTVGSAARDSDAPESYLEQELRRKQECPSCANRKYLDGSDDSAVSFQSPTKLPAASAESAVRSHEREHVLRETAKAKLNGGKVTSSMVRIRYAVCPDCGCTYVAGGETTTTVRTRSGAHDHGQLKQPSRKQRLRGMDTSA